MSTPIIQGIAAVNTLFLSILLQALPFMLLGSFLSSVVHFFIPARSITALFPKKYGFGFLTALCAGFFFPVCECASVPLMRGLIKKGAAMPVAVTFMLAAPIVNPISIISTLYAFPNQPEIAFFRVYFGLIIALGIGLLLMYYPEGTYLQEDSHTNTTQAENSAASGKQKKNNRIFLPVAAHRYIGTAVNRTAVSYKADKPSPFAGVHRIIPLLLHTRQEFFSTGTYLIIGAFITAVIRTAVPQSFFTIAAAHPVSGILIMMLFAFVFSACSTSDAFIARSFVNRFTVPALFGFLVYGPMMDIKNICMLMALFKKRFVIELAVIITFVNAIGIALLCRLFL